jgi:hypothetical protein
MHALHLLKNLSGTVETSPSPPSGKFRRIQVSRIQDFALCKVSCQPIAGNPTSPTQESVQATSTQDSALAVRHENNLQDPTQWS